MMLDHLLPFFLSLYIGMYEEDSDTLILELKQKLADAEEQLSMLSILPL